MGVCSVQLPMIFTIKEQTKGAHASSVDQLSKRRRWGLLIAVRSNLEAPARAPAISPRVRFSHKPGRSVECIAINDCLSPPFTNRLSYTDRWRYIYLDRSRTTTRAVPAPRQRRKIDTIILSSFHVRAVYVGLPLHHMVHLSSAV